ELRLVPASRSQLNAALILPGLDVRKPVVHAVVRVAAEVRLGIARVKLINRVKTKHLVVRCVVAVPVHPPKRFEKRLALPRASPDLVRVMMNAPRSPRGLRQHFDPLEKPAPSVRASVAIGGELLEPGQREPVCEAVASV